jgi:hypothetical protein
MWTAPAACPVPSQGLATLRRQHGMRDRVRFSCVALPTIARDSLSGLSLPGVDARAKCPHGAVPSNADRVCCALTRLGQVVAPIPSSPAVGRRFPQGLV